MFSFSHDPAGRSTPAQRARIATATTFLVVAITMGAWIPRIPEIKQRLDLSAGSLGLALLAPAIGSLIAIPLIGRACARFGSAATTRCALTLFVLLAAVPGTARSLPALWFGLLALGMAMGSVDVAMNAQGVTVEKAYGRPILSSFHAGWSVGTLIGAGVGSLGAAFEISIPLQQTAIALVGGAIALILSRAYLPDPEFVATTRVALRDRLRHFDLRLLLLGGAAVCALLAEGSVGNWSGVLLRDSIHVSAGATGLAYAAFTAAMTVGRMLGDRAVARFGATRIVTVVGGAGALGAAAGLASMNLIGLMIGYAILGIGLSSMVPIYFSAAARGGGAAGPALAVVSSMGYTGFLIGPAAIGAIASRTSVAAALGLVPVLLIVGIGLGRAGLRRTDSMQAPSVPNAEVSSALR